MTQPEPQEGALAFPCKGCGAKLSYDAGAQSMVCPYCGHNEAIASAGGGAGGGAMVRDIPIEEGMRMATRGLGTPVTTISCKDCGATVNVGQGERTTECAFCGSKQVLGQQTNETAIRPESLVPFKIAKDEANKRFGAWLSGLWFRPSNLKKMASLQEMGGVYVPFWAFNAFVASYWTAERGHHYYEEESYTATENGQSVQKTRRVQKTRWESASGQRSDQHQDVLVCAGKGLPTDLVDRFSTFDAKQLTPYRPEFIAGWRAEAYAIDLMPGWDGGQQKIATVQIAKCGGDVGGDTHRGLDVSNTFTNVSFKHVLLPIWIAAYRYNDKVFRFLVNGQTGEVVGKAPWSVWKIVLLVAVILAIIGTIIALASHGKASESTGMISFPFSITVAA